MKKWFALLLAIAMLPASAFAMTEGEVEEAPDIDLNVTLQVENNSYLPDNSLYAGYGGWTPDWEDADECVTHTFTLEMFEDVTQLPQLTRGETRRALRLLEAYEKGEADGNGASVLNVRKNVTIGVYPLDPLDFDGETMYLILPGTCLTDEQLLAIIDAYHQLGMTFAPERLSWRNCARGGGAGETRCLTEEERVRWGSISAQMRDGIFPEERVDDAARQQAIRWRISLDKRYFCGLPEFYINPYRSMTDAELAAGLIAQGVKKRTFDYDATLSKGIDAWGFFGTWLSYKGFDVNEGKYMPTGFGEDGVLRLTDNLRDMLWASCFTDAQDGATIWFDAKFDRESGEHLESGWGYDYMNSPQAAQLSTIGLGPEEFYVDHERLLTESEYIMQAQEYAASLPIDGKLAWHIHENSMPMHNWLCVWAYAQLPDGGWLNVYLDPATGRTMGAKRCTDAVKLFDLDSYLETDLPGNESGACAPTATPRPAD